MRLDTRSTERERIDGPISDEGALRLVHRDLARINRALGGTSGSLGIEPHLAGLEAPIVVDVGAGGADFPRALVARARQDGRRVRVVVLDVDPLACRLAAEACRGFPEIHVVRADGRRMPFADGGVDAAHAALFLHHLTEQEVSVAAGEMRRVSRTGALVNDLHRHWAAWLGIWCLTRCFAMSPLVRHDAPLSVRRGFRHAELARLLAGWTRPEIRWRWAFRYLVWMPGPDRGPS